MKRKRWAWVWLKLSVILTTNIHFCLSRLWKMAPGFKPRGCGRLCCAWLSVFRVATRHVRCMQCSFFFNSEFSVRLESQPYREGDVSLSVGFSNTLVQAKISQWLLIRLPVDESSQILQSPDFSCRATVMLTSVIWSEMSWELFDWLSCNLLRSHIASQGCKRECIDS